MPLRTILRRLLGDYALYRIYSCSPGMESVAVHDGARFEPLTSLDPLVQSSDTELRGLAPYAGREAFGFGAWIGADLAAACWFWVGDRYRQRNFWPLDEGEAKLVQIVTAERHRGRGLARELIRYSTVEMARIGFRRLYARVWHSNEASIRAFERAGWQYIAFVAEAHPFGSRRPARITWRRRSARG
jgi:RimJ/RimL family protein N-acetyltransferase